MSRVRDETFYRESGIAEWNGRDENARQSASRQHALRKKCASRMNDRSSLECDDA